MHTALAPVLAQKPRIPFFSRNTVSNMGLAFLAPSYKSILVTETLILVPNTVAHYYYLHHSNKAGMWLTISHTVIMKLH